LYYINRYPLPVPVSSWPAHQTHLTKLSPTNQSILFVIFLRMFCFYFILYYWMQNYICGHIYL
jgi:hypothetical protein